MPDNAPPSSPGRFQYYAATAIAAYMAVLAVLTLRAGVPWPAVAVTAIIVAGVTLSALRPDRQAQRHDA